MATCAGTVRFEAALRSVYGVGCRAYVEIGPQPVMLEIAGVPHDNDKCNWFID